ncbi:hypothetical protein D3C85_872160 [compost metagenome]
MSTEAKIEIAPGGRFRRQAGPYDLNTRLPRYNFEVVAADADALRRVVNDSQIMGSADNHFWVWDIKNNSTTPVFITLTKDGDPVVRP